MFVARSRKRIALSIATAAGLVGAMFVLLPILPTPQSAAAGEMTVTKSGDATVLVNTPIRYEMTASNPAGSSPLYNITFRDVLPVGVTYKPGSVTSPAGLGDPRIITNVVSGTPPNEVTQQVLIWDNVSDLPGGASQKISFAVNPDPVVHPVGSTISNTGDAYAPTGARKLVKFDAAGNPIPSSVAQSAQSAAFQTKITAITIDKSEPSPESELLRGVHDHTTVYTLKVTNNSNAATNSNQVVDYIPAGLEFLGCGGVDNGTVQEYGSKTLTGTPSPTGACEPATKVETVQLAADEITGLAAGVYTKVTWDIGNLAANGTWTTNYRAGIPQRANVLFPGGTATTGVQASNLDNNTGADTRESNASTPGADGNEVGLTNHARVQGSYTGTVFEDGDPVVFDTSEVTVEAEDLSLQKSVSPKEFEQGGVATYTLKVNTGEYASASNVVITDVIPDGMCPLSTNASNKCAAGAADFTATGATITSVTANGDGTWTIVFDPIAQAHNKTTTITYKGWMRANYTGKGTAPTVSGDGYTNKVSLVGTTTTRSDVNAPDGGGVDRNQIRDDSSATITSDGPSLTKTIGKQNASVTPYKCDTATYVKNGTGAGKLPANDPDLTFRIGDRVCFIVRVDFSTGNQTKNAVLTDFLPSYVDYEDESAKPTANHTMDPVVPVVDTSDDQHTLTWTLGDLVGSDRFVDKGAVFEYRLSAIVTKDPNTPPTPDVTGNLAKLVWEDTAGDVGFLRDQVDFSIGAIPPLKIDKTHAGGNTGYHGGDPVNYTIKVTNDGKTENRNDIPVKKIVVTDTLPTGVTCAAITNTSNSGTCAAGVITWTLAGPLAAGFTTSVTYTMTVPGNPGVLAELTNTARITSYDTTTNQGTDKTTPSTVSDTDKITIANTGLTKTQKTAVKDLPGNDTDNQATIGEVVTYTVKATVPKHTTVYNGVVSDPMPTGIELLSATAQLDGAALPGGVTLTPVVGAAPTGKVSLDLAPAM